MALVVQRELLAQGLDRPMAPIFQARRAGIAPESATLPLWAHTIRSQTVAEFLRNFRHYSLLAHGTRRRGDEFLFLAEMNADRLLSLFLKLNISDPNNDAAILAMLQRLSTELRRQGIEEAAEKAEEAKEAIEEAEACQNDPVAALVKALLSFLGL